MRTVSGIEVTTVSTTAQFPVGGVFSVAQPGTDLPPSVWRYVKCVTTALAAGDLASYLLTTDGLGKSHVLKSLATAGHKASIAGVAQHAIALLSYGFIQIGGVGVVKVAGTPAVGIGLVDSGTTGVAAAAADVTKGIIGMNMVVGNSGAAVTCIITLEQ